MRSLRILASLFLLALLQAPFLAAQIPGVDVSLKPEAGVVPMGKDAALVLTIDVKQAADLPAELISGMNLAAKAGTGTPVEVKDPGKGSGTVPLAAGTKIERRLTVPVSKLLPGGTTGPEFTNVEISWSGQASASCILKVAPDSSQVNLDDLDQAKTKVVLVTSMGEMTLGFYPEKAPNHVRNFLDLAKKGFYDGTKFHRVMRNFMIQGGDPNTRTDDKPETWGQGGSGTKLKAEFNDTHHVRGTLSMARGDQDIDSASSQFFIVHKDSNHLDNHYTAFGALEHGADVLDKIATTPVTGQQGTTPVTPVILYYAIVLPAKKA
jgi:peptidyl-prolyl cis-trans isomerase B (cyclophilin B)